MNREAVERIERNICNHMDWCGCINCEKCEVNLAVEALKKQTPKKPINLTCPTCGFDRIDNSWWVFTYCPKCGQLLDWEEIE